ncbi:hypothetical protein SAMN02745121_02006 [Nannocystis exedens]|uniref:NHL repeat-containing protein n=1 Tax=Nannocystis exedens TaxID=54 RepID=A0A1I1VV96_9BACT|nr:hypothetical protein [Nannocystis exedens]PCC72888.1 hypothetical protein NAEX_05974 [Nannocystis exedens]SFD87016.1 hypothetical protein SAMN02745121_02006 [Nannocystis exedens]
MSTAAAPRYYCDAAEHFIGTRATEADPVYAGSRGAPGAVDGPRRKARFHGPRALTEGGASLLFVADTGNGAVRSIDTRAGVVNTALTLADICTIAHVHEFAPSGLACDGEWLVIADTRNHVVWRYDLRSYRLAVLAGCPGTPGDIDGEGQQARFWLPVAVALADDGRGFVVSEARGRRHVSRSGDVRTLGR